MSYSPVLQRKPVVIEKFVTLGATSGTVVGPAVSAGTLVLAAGIEVLSAVPDITTYTVNVTDGTTTFANAVSIDAAAKGTIRVGTTAGYVAANDTIDAVTTISGSPGAIPARIFALVVDVNGAAQGADEVDRDQLA